MRASMGITFAWLVTLFLIAQADGQEIKTGTSSNVVSRGPSRDHVFVVGDFGAVGDGKQLDTPAIQAAIDACSKSGGGTVLVPPGRYLIGTLFLRSRINLHLMAGSVLLGSPDLKQYATNIERCGFVIAPEIDKCLIYAANEEGVSLTGLGMIDGQGRLFPLTAADGKPGERPMLLRLVNCKNVAFEGVTLKNAAAWCSHFLRCSGVRIHGITIHSRQRHNNDGIDLMNTQQVRISDCTLLCEDDCICFQNLSHDHPVRDIVITNCVMSTRWAAIRSGGAHHGGIRNVTVSNCVIYDTYGCGVKLQISGSGTMEDMTFSNLVMTNVSCPISLRYGTHEYGEKLDPSLPRGSLKNVLFSNIRASVLDEASLRKGLSSFYADPNAKPYPGEERQCISICGIPGHPVEGVSLSDVHVTYPGGGTREDAAKRDMPEMADVYPEYFMWGVLPAYGLYARHVKGLALKNVRFDLASPDLRPAVVCDDAEDVEIAGLRAAANRDAESWVRLRSSRNAFLHGCRPLDEVATLLRVEGRESREILLSGNDSHRVKTVVQTADGAESGAVRVTP